MESFRRILRDPLAHFLAIGGALFAAYAFLHPGSARDADETTIVVDKAALVNFIQYRQSAFETEAFSAQFEALSAEDRKLLIDAYIREEAMVREARALGMDRGDYVIRQRLVQKILFLIDGAGQREIAPPSETELRRFYTQHVGAYRNSGEVSFTHVFIDKEVEHLGGGEAAARVLLARLNARRAGFNDAPQYGDRFPFTQNFVGKPPEMVTDQFGKSFTQALARLKPSAQWQGPVRSDYGWHLVLVMKQEPARLPELEAIREQVLGDWIDEQRGTYRDKAIDELLEQYTIRIEPDAKVD